MFLKWSSSRIPVTGGMNIFSSLPFGRPVLHSGQARIPITVLTGFLGVGKTTILRALLASPEGQGTALIVNEFGEIGIDDVLLRAGGEQTRLLGNGCLCCAIQSDLQRTLRELFTDRQVGRVPSFQRVIIETSGLANPSSILQTLASDRGLRDCYALSAVVTVVDALLAERSARYTPEWAQQVALADRVLVTKLDLTEPGAFERIRSFVRAINPVPAVLPVSRGLVAPNELLADAFKRFAATVLACDSTLADTHARQYQSFAITIRRPIPWGDFVATMRTLTEFCGDDLLRVKGFVWTESRPGPVLVNFVQHLAFSPEELQSWPDADQSTRLVFITRRVTRQQVTNLFDAILALHLPQAFPI